MQRFQLTAQIKGKRQNFYFDTLKEAKLFVKNNADDSHAVIINITGGEKYNNPKYENSARTNYKWVKI